VVHLQSGLFSQLSASSGGIFYLMRMERWLRRYGPFRRGSLAEHFDDEDNDNATITVYDETTMDAEQHQ